MHDARRFAAAYPNGEMLSAGDIRAAAGALDAAGVRGTGGFDRVEVAGQGNMNLVLRVSGPGGSVIVKQARPWVEKYPTIDAPAERAAVEAAFYSAIRGVAGVADAMPALLGVAAGWGVVVLEDLGEAPDLASCYDGGPLGEAETIGIARYLGSLHGVPVGGGVLRNRAMRGLNHAHIFDLPFSAPGLEMLDGITPGLGAVAERLTRDESLVSVARELGVAYLRDGDRLLHGDIHPGSVLRTLDGLRVIDPEFAFGGPCEFDLGVLTAHVLLSGVDATAGGRLVLDAYGSGRDIDARLVSAFAGIEILRRLLGVAQLPISRTLGEKIAMVELGREMAVGRS